MLTINAKAVVTIHAKAVVSAFQYNPLGIGILVNVDTVSESLRPSEFQHIAWLRMWALTRCVHVSFLHGSVAAFPLLSPQMLIQVRANVTVEPQGLRHLIAYIHIYFAISMFLVCGTSTLTASSLL